tara:strand:+ start:1751 stop:2107 length:357 start_codon:yes stop_codon:yes gene_type:complete
LLARRFSYDFQSCFLFTGLRNKAFQHLTFMINRSPQVAAFTGDLHEHLVEVPPPLARLHPLDSALSDLGREKRTEPVPSIPDRLVAHIDAAFMEPVFNISKRERETNIRHHSQPNDHG